MIAFKVWSPDWMEPSDAVPVEASFAVKAAEKFASDNDGEGDWESMMVMVKEGNVVKKFIVNRNIKVTFDARSV